MGAATGFPRFVWEDAVELRPKRRDVIAGVKYRALVQLAARLQAAIREGGGR